MYVIGIVVLMGAIWAYQDPIGFGKWLRTIVQAFKGAYGN